MRASACAGSTFRRRRRRRRRRRVAHHRWRRRRRSPLSLRPFSVRPRESHSKTRLSSDKEDGDGRDGGERRPSALFRIFRLLSDDDAVADADQNSIRPLLTMTPVLRPPD